jgi:hypothetical protein
MKNSRDSRKPHKVRKLRVLTKLEKLEGQFPGLATEARQLLDKGVPASKAAQILSAHFPVTLTESIVRSFRVKRWGPSKDKVEEGTRTLEIFFNKVGGNHGLDLAAFARIRELMDTSDIKEANSIRLALLKMRAQDLKEEEFKLKTCQLKASQSANGEDADPEAQSRKALQRIKEIFGLTPEDAPGPPPAHVAVATAGKESV